MKNGHQTSKLCQKMLLALLLVLATTTSGQSANQNQFWENVRFGGGFGLGFGSNTFNLQLSPSAIYEANAYYATGLGLQLNYSKFGDNKLLAYGATWMNFVNPIPEIQLSAELEQWRVNLSSNDPRLQNLEENYWLTALFLGAGYRNGPFTVGLRYNVLHNENRGIYANALMPFFRVYF